MTTPTAPVDLHAAVLPPVTRALKNLAHVLVKGEVFAREQNWEDTRLTEFRLAPDMLPLKNQVYIATDVAKFAVGRTVAGVTPPSFPDTETTFAELVARVHQTVAFLEGVTPGALAGKEDHPVTLKQRAGEMNLKGVDYLLGFVVPNVYFHATTAYDILRHNGVPLGKADFLGLNRPG